MTPLRHLHEAAAAVYGDRLGHAVVLHYGDSPAEYAALTATAGMVDLSDRTQIELTGDDRAKFLHNLTTNDIRRLTPGTGCETFLTNPQGKTLGHGYVFCRADSLVFDTVPRQGEKLMAHFDRYLIREKVELHDRTAERVELLVAGALAPETLASLGAELPADRLEHRQTLVGGQQVELRRVDLTHAPGFLVVAPLAGAASLWTALEQAGVVPAGYEAFDAARLEAGTPLYAQDITDENLPQEVARDQLAISFTKGCYIGQETVARIDALGHVNKMLVGLRFPHLPVPPPGTELTVGGKTMGRVTSAAFSPRLGVPLALAYVRRESRQPGSRLASAFGEAEVVALPLGV